MSATIPPAPRSRLLALDDVILLNDEIRGLIAAGVPLDVGLSGFADRVHGRLKAFSGRLAPLDCGRAGLMRRSPAWRDTRRACATCVPVCDGR